MSSMFLFFQDLLLKNSYIQGFQRAYCYHLGNIAFNQIQTLENTCDKLLNDRINEGINQIEELDQKLILVSTGKKPYTLARYQRALQFEKLPFSIKSEIVNMRVISTPFFQNSIDKSKLKQVFKTDFIKMYTEKANIFQLFGKVVNQDILFRLVLQLTLKIQTDLIMQSVSQKKSAEQVQHSGKEMHFIEFQGQIKQFNQSNIGLLVQSLRKQNRIEEMFKQQFEISNIIIANFDNCLKDERWNDQEMKV